MMNLSKFIDHTLLKADATVKDIEEVCNLALHYNTASVCVNPIHTKVVKEYLRGSDVKTCVVVGFPLGANKSEVKAYEAELALKDGAEEIDMVLNIGALKDKNYDLVYNDIEGLVKVTRGKAVLKVIFETCLLEKNEIIKACQLSLRAGADFVKTSTGFSNGGATVEDVELMRSIVGDEMGVKASGGVRSQEDAIRMIEAGANRLGASATKSIVKGTESKSAGY